MKILDRYIFRQFAKAFIFTSTTFVFLFILITMVEHLDDMLGRNLSIFQIVGYYLLSIPSTILVTAPVSSLLASILVAGRLSASSELSAIRSAGVSMRQILYPFLAGASLICMVNLVNACWIAPAAFGGIARFEREHWSKNPGQQRDNRNMHLIEKGNRIVTIGSVANDDSTAKSVSIEEFSGAHLNSRIDAPSMSYNSKSGEWILQNAAIRSFTPGKELFSSMSLMPVKLSISPRSLQEFNLQPDEMNVNRHYRYLTEKRQAGIAGLDRSAVKFYTKLSLPFASLIVMLIGVPLSAKKKRGGLASEITVALFFGFLFIGLQKTISIAGYQGAINPMLAAWLPNIIFLIVGYVIYKTAID
ncbi:MAG: LPS export ABC transporter permease LptG [Chlorobiaceae bacterium]|nr:LPS export ABC transporter permease LptG [Chlorobiaceae bacterium]